MNGPLVYAFGVGMVATFNPCGFAMLPAYVSYFLGLEDAEHHDDRDEVRAVGRALAVGTAMTLGFVVVFGLIGIVLEPFFNRIIDRLPWVTIVLGLVLVGLGVAMLAGRTITVRLPKMTKGTDSRELGSVFLFGISYALVSLSCTFPLFYAAVSVRVYDESVLVGIGTYIAYALGMGLVLMVLTLAIALARQSLVRRMRGVMPYVSRVSGGLLVLAGLYVAYYGWYELRVYDGDTSGGGVAQWMFDLSGRMSRWIESVGPVRVGLVLALAIALAVLIVLARRNSAEARNAVTPPVDGRAGKA
ncbi:MAG TPA: cytochrome c biogenesis CcdA family protein [Acidimicrobiales bacterium]